MNITVCSQKKVEHHLASTKFDAHLCFDDGTGRHPNHETLRENRDGMDYLYEFVWDTTPALLKPGKHLVKVEQMIRVIDFLKEHSGKKILINCTAGRSRSTSAAMIVKYIFGESRSNAARWLYTAYPRSMPNGLMLKMADILIEEMGSGYSLFDCAEICGFVKWNYRNPRHQAKSERINNE